MVMKTSMMGGFCNLKKKIASSAILWEARVVSLVDLMPGGVWFFEDGQEAAMSHNGNLCMKTSREVGGLNFGLVFVVVC